jgi:hypothetical protein
LVAFLISPCQIHVDCGVFWVDLDSFLLYSFPAALALYLWRHIVREVHA